MSRCCRAMAGHVRWIIKLEHFRFQLRHAHKYTHTDTQLFHLPELSRDVSLWRPFFLPDFVFSCIFNLYVCLGINSMIFSIFINLNWHRHNCADSSSTSVQACRACSSQIKSGLNVASLLLPLPLFFSLGIFLCLALFLVLLIPGFHKFLICISHLGRGAWHSKAYAKYK